MNNLIDIVIPWVDGSDPVWRKEKNQYDPRNSVSDTRYESWDNLQYVFRGIEKFMPWFHNIFFVTWGHIPSWLNLKNDRLKVIKHSDYIPAEYLPTFNSNVIEMNYHRIKELSENFILFNDDLFPIRFIPQEYYFQNNIPCEEAVETHFVLSDLKEDALWMAHASVNNMVIINRNFNKREVIAQNSDKWFSPVYGNRIEQNQNLLFWNNFESFVYPHEAMPMKKSVLAEIWQKEREMLDTASHNRFRAYSDVTHRLLSAWQICSGEFVPKRHEGKFFLINEDNCYEVARAIREQSYPMLSLNEENAEQFSIVKAVVNEALNDLLPEKSDFEV